MGARAQQEATEKDVWGLVTKKVAVPSSFLSYKAPQTPSIHPNVLWQLKAELSIWTEIFKEDFKNEVGISLNLQRGQL